MLTDEEVVALITLIWKAMERTILDTVAAEIVAEGFNEDDVCRAIGNVARRCARGEVYRLEAAIAMLKTGSMQLQ